MTTPWPKSINASFSRVKCFGAADRRWKSTKSLHPVHPATSQQVAIQPVPKNEKKCRAFVVPNDTEKITHRQREVIVLLFAGRSCTEKDCIQQVSLFLLHCLYLFESPGVQPFSQIESVQYAQSSVHPTSIISGQQARKHALF